MPRTRLILPTYISQGMIIQQNRPFTVRGQADPLTSVEVAYSRSPADNRPVSPLDPEYGVIYTATPETDADGLFSFELPALKASFDPLTLLLSCGKSKIEVSDILVGELWLALGADNMAYPVHATTDKDHLMEQANTPYVRFLCPHPLIPENPPLEPAADFVGGCWLYGDEPRAMADRSATAFAFARELCQELRLPVGVIDLAIYGLKLQSLLPREVFANNIELRDWSAKSGQYRDESNWNLQGGFNFNQPGAIYNSRLAPLQRIVLRGIIWQQGENDYRQPAECALALKHLVDVFNELFVPAGSQLNLLIAQLPPFYTGSGQKRLLARYNEMLARERQHWPCDSALLALYDLPPDFRDAPEPYNQPHTPAAKQQVGQRLKLIACGLIYQRKAPASAPECSNIELVGNKLMISFSQTGSGLRLAGENDRLRGFTICGQDGIYLEASARLLYGLRVLVWHDQINHPVAVTYADLDLNVEANLVSRDGLAVIPFRSSDKPGRQIEPMEWAHFEQLQTWAVPAIALHKPLPDQLPVYEVLRGLISMRIERNNKSEGEGSLQIFYETDNQKQAMFRPILEYASLNPPLDISPFKTLLMDVFNPDQQFKVLAIEVKLAREKVNTEAVEVKPAIDKVDYEVEEAKPATEEVQAPNIGVSTNKKAVSLGQVNIEPALRWQTLRFNLSNLPPGQRQITELAFLLTDRKGKGQLYFDNLRFLL